MKFNSLKQVLTQIRAKLEHWQQITGVSAERKKAEAERIRKEEEEAAKAAEYTAPTLGNAIMTLYSKGKEFASKIFGRTFFDVARTPDFMKALGLSGEKFTVRYGVLSRHFGKDGSHDLTMAEWEQLPSALQTPFAIAKLADREKGYRLYTTLQNSSGEYVVVGVDVKNAGRDLEVNAISTLFGRREDAKLTTKEDVI